METVRLSVTPPGERIIRLLCSALARAIPDAIQYRCFASLKRAAFRWRGGSPGTLLHAWDHLEAPASSGAGPGCFAVTHDVDYLGCHTFVARTMELDRDAGVRATYNFLTGARYRLDDALLRKVLDAGHEIGLHGLDHDRALGVRSEARIRRFLETARNELERRVGPVVGFRAPALSVSPALFRMLDALGFAYDSSLAQYGLHTQPVSSPGVCRVEDFKVLEIPLTIQDSLYANDIPLDDADLQRVMARLIGIFEARGGVLVANFHPIVIRGNPARYQALIRMLKQSTLQNLLMKEIAARHE